MSRITQFLFKNTSTRQTIAKNTLWLFVGEIAGRLLKFGVIIFATRVLGAAGWGTFSYAMAFVSVFYVFGDIGINTFITKEMTKSDGDKYQYLSASLALKLGLLTLSFIASLLLIPHVGNVALNIKIVLALALLNFSDALREFVLSVNRALEKMEREAFIKILMSAVITILGITLLLMHANPLSLAIAYAVGSIISSIAAIWIVLPELRHIKWHIPLKAMVTILDYAWPFVATTIFFVVIANIDTIMLGQVRSVAEVGYYAAAERIVQFLAIIPIFIGLSTFPLMSKKESDGEAMTQLLEKIMVTVLAVGTPIAIGGFLLSQKLMATLFGSDYIAGGLVLAILMFSIFADFPNIILSNVIFAKNLQKKFIIATGIGVVANVLLNLYLIPLYGAIGAAISTVLSQLLIMGINWQMLKRFLSFSVIPKTGRIGLAAIAMTFVIFFCTIVGIYFLVTIAVAIVVYSGTLYLLQDPILKEVLSIIF